MFYGSYIKKGSTKATLLGIILGIIIGTLILGLPTILEAKAPITINFPTASPHGALYSVGATITTLWNTKLNYVRASNQASNGGLENISLVCENEAQVSIAVSSNVYQCYNGLPPFTNKANKGLRIIAGLYLNPNQVVVNKHFNIEKLLDIKGKRFAVASAGSSVYGECENHFTAAGLAFPDDINCVYVTFNEAADLIKNEVICGAWIMSGIPASAVTHSLINDGELLNIDEHIFNALREKYPWYVKYTIPANTYPHQKEDIHTTSIKMVMFCMEDLSDDLVYDLTKTFWTNIGILGKFQPNLANLTPENAVKDIADLPIHNGAIRFYKEIGVLK